MSKKKKQQNQVKENSAAVDVVIPVYGNYEFLPKGLELLKDAFNGVSYKVWFVDDSSPEYLTTGKEIWKELKLKYPEIGSVLVHNQNTGYPKSVNDGAALGKAPYLLILNSDVMLSKMSAFFMYTHMESNQEVGIAFPKLLFFPNSNDARRPASKIQHAGVVFDIEAMPYHIFVGWNPDHPFVNSIKDFNACTGAAFMIRRDLWRKLGGYDLAYGRGTYEDMDLSLRVRMTGNKVRYLPMSVGFHFTNASLTKYGVGFPINQNRQIFLQKFGDKIPYDEIVFSST